MDTIEHAVARAAGHAPISGGDLRAPGGLVKLFTECRLEIVAAGDVEIPWVAADADTLVRAVLLGEAPAVVVKQAPVVLDAARPFRTRAGGYRLSNAFQYAIGALTPRLALPAQGADVDPAGLIRCCQDKR